MDQLIGFLSGVLGSIGTWWIFAHWLVPSVVFYDRIIVRPPKERGGRRLYLVKFENVGRRNLIDVTMLASVSIQTVPGSEMSWSHSRLAFHMNRDISHQFPIVPAGGNRLLTLHAEYSDQIRYDMNFSEEVRKAVKNRSLDLLRLMRDGESRGCKVRLRLHLFGFDSFSGARKLFSSKSYEADDFEFQQVARSKSA